MKKILPFLILFLSVLFIHQKSWSQCVPTLVFPGVTGDYVDNFTFGTTISNLASGDAANDYNVYSQTQNVIPGQSYSFTIQTGSSTWNQGLGMWIDYNNDLVFNSTNEFVWASPTSNNTSANVLSGTITIPSTTTPGIKKLRICAKFAAVVVGTDACGGFNFGEFEEYFLNVLSLGPSDPAVTFISQPSGNCFSAAQVFSVRVKNYGSSTLNFNSTNTLKVMLNVNGPSGLVVYDTLLTSGSLAPFGADSITAVFTAPFNNALNLYAGGSYSINSTLLITGYGNANLQDDSLPSPIVLVNYRPTQGPTYSLCQYSQIPFGQGLTVSGCATPIYDSVTINFTVTPCIDNVGATGGGTSTGAPANCANQFACTFASGTLPSLPIGAYFTQAAKLTITNLSSGFPTECRFNLFGAIPDGPTLYSGCPTPYNTGANDINVGGAITGNTSLFTYNRNIPSTGISAMYSNLTPGATVRIGYFELWNDFPTASDINANVGGPSQVSLKIYYQYVPPSFEWYDVPAGGTSLYSLSPFNPLSVPNSVVNNSNVPGTYVLYASCVGSSNCRVADTLIIKPAPAVFQDTLISCENLSSSNTAIVNLQSLNNGVSGGNTVDSIHYFYDMANLSPVIPEYADTTGTIVLYSKVYLGQCSASDSVLVFVNSTPEIALYTNAQTLCAPDTMNVLDFINPFSYSPTGTDTFFFQDASCTIPFSNPYAISSTDSVYIVMITNSSPACADTVGVVVDVAGSSGLIANETNLFVSTCSSVDSIPQIIGAMVDGDTRHFFNPTDCKRLATLTDLVNGQSLGSTMVHEVIDCPTPFYNGWEYLNRHFQIEPLNQDSAEVCLYILDDDVAAFNQTAIDSSTTPISPNLGNLCIHQYHGGDITNPLATLHVIDSNQVSISYNPSNTAYSVCFKVDSFSYFYCTVCSGFVALPVGWKTFTARRVDKTSLLNWTTSEEKNNHHFIVERSRDGKSFLPISNNIPSKSLNGNSSVELNYTFIDQTPLSGHNYYRITQVDIDNHESQSYIKEVYFGEEIQVSAYPNPATDELQIDIQSPQATSGTITLMDATGRVIKQIQTQMVEGLNHLSIQLQDLSAGIYQLQVSNEKGLKNTQRIRKD